MESKVLPTIFALDDETFEKKLNILEFCDEIHLDFMSGDFTPKSSVGVLDMKSILKFPKKKFQIHLMAKNPLVYLDSIKSLNISTVLIQEEVFNSVKELSDCIEEFKENSLEVLVVLNPDTSFDKVKKIFNKISGIMLMSVVPGAEGQSFIESTFDKVSELRKMVNDDFIIQIDGGVNVDNCQRLKESGANYLCVGSFISSSKTPVSNYEKLLTLIK